MFLEGKTAVVTGGGRGIGAAIARELAEVGARVVVAARTGAEVEQVAAELDRAGHRAESAICDVTDPDSVAALAELARKGGHRVDVLVNNAGVAASAPVARISLESWHRILEVNATGTFLATRAMLPDMVEAGWGRVVNIASIAGLAGAAYIAAYSASKHAVIGFTRSVAAEVAKAGVTVNAICPGYVETAMTELTVETITAKTDLSEDAARDGLSRMSPQGRIFEPEEVAFLVRFLCHPRARGINGETLTLNGGPLAT